jgi:flagellar protein FliS
MILQPQNSYMNTKIQTSSPGELTLMLYNGCIRFTKQAINCMNQRDYEGKHTNFIKAQNIIDELQSTLNMDYELSHQLNSLYLFISKKLMEANVKRDQIAAEECIGLVTELRDTWAEALKSVKRGEQVQPT